MTDLSAVVHEGVEGKVHDGVVHYSIGVTLNAGAEDETQWLVDRRFNDFIKLNSALKTDGRLSAALSESGALLPGKHPFGMGTGAALVERRVAALQAFMQRVLGHGALRSCSPLLKFLKVGQRSAEEAAAGAAAEAAEAAAAPAAPSTFVKRGGFPDYNSNIIIITDSYKLTHFKQYPPGAEIVYSYFESRGGKWDEVVFFGLQYFMQRYLAGPVVTREGIEQAAEFAGAHLGNASYFNKAGWEYILEKHGGRLPVAIKAVPEGTLVPTQNVMFTLENTDPACYWLTNYLETLLVQVWYPMTVATNSRSQKEIISKWLARTGSSSTDGLNFKLHDFGFRGVSSVESAALGGAAHLVNFMGTDTMAGYVMARQHYDCPMAGNSVPASEHSTMTSWTRDGEAAAYRNMLEQHPTGIVSVVSDSYDIINACENIWGGELKELVMAREGTLVVRPDSGDPPVIVVQVLEALGRKFPTTLTSTRHRLLPPQLRVIQGDGIDAVMLERVLVAVADAGWAADNLAFGSGGALLQKLNRDTQKCAFKCSEITIDGAAVDVYKDPVTDPGKRSKRGRLTLQRNAETGRLETTTEGRGDPARDVLVEVFRDGEVLRRWSFDEVRARAELPPQELRTVQSVNFRALLSSGVRVKKRPLRGSDVRDSVSPKTRRSVQARVLFCDDRCEVLYLSKSRESSSLATCKQVRLQDARFITEHADEDTWINVRDVSQADDDTADATHHGTAVFHIGFESKSVRDKMARFLGDLRDQLHLEDPHTLDDGHPAHAAHAEAAVSHKDWLASAASTAAAAAATSASGSAGLPANGPVPADFMTIQPYFSLPAGGMTAAISATMERFVTHTMTERAVLWYDWTVSDDGATLHNREAYFDSEGLLAHLENVNAELRALNDAGVEVLNMDLSGAEACLRKLDQADEKKHFFPVADGAFAKVTTVGGQDSGSAFVSTIPYLTLRDGMTAQHAALLDQIRAAAADEATCLYFGACWNETTKTLFLREAYKDAAAVRAHNDAAGGAFEQLCRAPGNELTRQEVHGPKAEVDKLRSAPFLEGAQFFTTVGSAHYNAAL
jgi:nicotinamide phosphoribosyltransferase